MKLVCKSGGVAEGYATAGSNGCANCVALRKLCSTSCNYCYSGGTSVATTTSAKTTTTSVNRCTCFDIYKLQIYRHILEKITVLWISILLAICTFYFFLDCTSQDSYQLNSKTLCEDWFDYTNGCYDSTCDGSTRMSLTSDASAWLSAQGYSVLTSTTMCGISAPHPLTKTTPLIEVQAVCSQICDYCAPSTSASSTTSTTTVTNTCKFPGRN